MHTLATLAIHISDRMKIGYSPCKLSTDVWEQRLLYYWGRLNKVVCTSHLYCHHCLCQRLSPSSAAAAPIHPTSKKHVLPAMDGKVVMVSKKQVTHNLQILYSLKTKHDSKKYNMFSVTKKI